jgi:hypothetical protein
MRPGLIAMVFAVGLVKIAPTYAVSMASPALSLVDKITVINEPIDSGSRQCGIDANMVQSAVRYPLTRTGLKIVAAASQADGVMDISVVTRVIMGSICVTAYKVDVDTYLTALFKGKEFNGFFTMWSSAGFISSPTGDHAGRIRNALESEAKDFIVDWSGARSGSLRYPYSRDQLPHSGAR